VPPGPGGPGHDAAEPLHPDPCWEPAGIPPRGCLRYRQGQRHAPGLQRRGDHPGPAAPRHQPGGRAQLRGGRLRGALDSRQGAGVERCSHVQHGARARVDPLRRPGPAHGRADWPGNPATGPARFAGGAGAGLRRPARALHRPDDQGLRRGRSHPRRDAPFAFSLPGDRRLHRPRHRCDGRRRGVQLLGRAGRADCQRGGQPGRDRAGGLR